MYTNAAKQLLFTPWRSLVLLGEQRSVSPMLIIRLGVELFHGSFLFSSWKREDYMHCMNYSHSNIANLPPVSCTSLCTNTHTHTHTLPFAVMNYVHTVYSLINWRCRLRQKRLHKAIPLLFFLLQFIHCTWKWTAAAQLPPSPQLLTLWLACDKTPLVEKVLWTRRQGEQPEAYFLVCVLCKKKVQ